MTVYLVLFNYCLPRPVARKSEATEEDVKNKDEAGNCAEDDAHDRTRSRARIQAGISGWNSKNGFLAFEEIRGVYKDGMNGF